MTLIAVTVAVAGYICLTLAQKAESIGITRALRVAGAGVPLLIVWILSTTPGQAERGTRPGLIAWTGVETAEGVNQIEIAGSADTSIRWPGDYPAPSLKVTGGSGLASVQIERGLGFVRIGEQDANGTGVEVGGRVPVRGFTISSDRPTWKDYLIHRADVELRVFDSGGTMLANWTMKSLNGRRVYAVDDLVARSATRLRARSLGAEAERLEEWASGLRLLRYESETRILDREESRTVSTSLPVNFQIYWVGRSLSGVISRTSIGMALQFDPPWRAVSPVPPDSAQTIVVTAAPKPGDYAFTLPLGAGLTNLRAHFQIEKGQFVGLGTKQVVGSDFTQRVSAFRNSAAVAAPAHGTSRVSVPLGDYLATLETIESFPIDLAVMTTLVISLLSLFIAFHSIRFLPEPELSTVRALVLAVWAFLALRVLFAFRYAFDPASIDRLALDGVTGAVVAVTLVPILVALAPALWVEQFGTTSAGSSERRKRGRQFFTTISSGALLAVLQALVPIWVWPTLAALLRPSTQFWLATVAAVFLFAWLHITFRFWLADALPHRSQVRPTIVGRLSFGLVSVLKWIAIGLPALARKLVASIGYRMWASLVTVEGVGADRPSRDSFWRNFVQLFGFVLGITAFLFLATLSSTGAKYSQEFGVIVLCWIPAGLWLSARLVAPPGATHVRVRWLRATVLGAAFVLFPVIVVPIALRDPGGMVATASVFIPMLLILMVGGRPFRFGAIAAGAFGLSISVLFGLYLNAAPLIESIGAAGQAGSRILAFKEGGDIVGSMAFLDVDDQFGGNVTSSTVRDSWEHTWENRAIAHFGSWRGAGFGNAPVRRSFIRQDTLQYDSQFSFYVLAEHGMWGGLGLISLYALLAVIILASARQFLDAGHSIALLVAGAFVLEGTIHALMNVGALPFTGRNLPLLAVNSKTDLFRWTMLLCLAAQAVMWRRGGASHSYAETTSLLSGVRATPSLNVIESSTNYWSRVGAWFAIPVIVVVGFLGYSTSLVVLDTSLARPFDWSALLDQVRDIVSRKELQVNDSDLTLSLSPNLTRVGTSLLEQEVARFNASPRELRLEPTILRRTSTAGAFDAVSSLGAYDKALAKLIADTSARSASVRRPSLFVLEEPIQWVDEDESIPAVGTGYRIQPNPEFNAKVSFDKPVDPESLPTVRFRGTGATGRILYGDGYEISVGPTSTAGRVVTLRDVQKDGTLRVHTDVVDTGKSVKVSVQFQPASARRRVDAQLGEFRLEGTRLLFQPGELRTVLVDRTSPTERPIPSGRFTEIKEDQEIRTIANVTTNLRPSVRNSSRQLGVVVGPAWVMGGWETVSDGTLGIPWAATLATSLVSEWRTLGREAASARYSELSLDEALHRAMQNFVRVKGRSHHSSLLAAGGRQTKVPPRVAFTSIDISTGEVLGLGGWPHQSVGFDQKMADGEVLPGDDWVARRAPRLIRGRYEGDRNFDRLVAGSSTKPIWAAVALSMFPQLDRQLAVRGPEMREAEVFGIPVTPNWGAEASRSIDGNPWSDFSSYLARSDNRYHIRLGFLALASKNQDGQIGTLGVSPSDVESIDGGRSPWKSFPAFSPRVGFGAQNPRAMDLVGSELEVKFKEMFGVASDGTAAPRKRSFWSGDESDDWLIRSDGKEYESKSLDYLSPQAVNLDFETVDSPRKYVTVLLGGGTSMWSNVEFSAAFATAVTGSPVVGHVTKLTEGAKPLAERTEFRSIAKKLWPGLGWVISSPSGTAYSRFKSTGALAVIERLRLSGVVALAKTGTLGISNSSPNTSRIALALVKESGGSQSGLVLSLVTERAVLGTATEWLGQFIAENEVLIRHKLGLD